MKKILSFVSGFLLLFSIAQGNDTITFKKAYQGKNIFVQNPYDASLKSFCTIKVMVNDSTVMDNIERSAYEIDLSFVRVNETVKIQIVHQSGCLPKVLSPISHPRRAFQFLSLNITEQDFNFATVGEAKDEQIAVESFMYNQWVQVNEVPVKGSALLNKYVQPSILHSGVNKIRLRHISADGYLTYSAAVEYVSKLPVVQYSKGTNGDIFFNREVSYELMNDKGKILDKGTSATLSMNKRAAGIYFIYADNQIFKLKHK